MHYAVQLAVWHSNPPPLPFCSLLSTSSPPPSTSQDLMTSNQNLMTSNPLVSLPPTLSSQSRIEKAALSSRLLPSSFSLHVFRFTQSCFQWPLPSNFPPIFPRSCSSRWKVGVLILLHHEKLPAQSGTTLWARSAILFSLFHSRCWHHSQILNLCLISFLFPHQWVHTLRLHCCLTFVFSFVCPHLLTGSIYWSQNTMWVNNRPLQTSGYYSSL